MTIKKLGTFFSTLFVLIGLTTQAQTKETPSVFTPENALLWEITGKGLTKPSYLYGTIHMIPKADFFLTDATKKALSESQKVMFEINMKDMQNPMMLISVMSKAMMPRGQKLRDLISADDYALVKARFDAIGMPLPMLEMIKPMFLSALVEGGDNPMDSAKSETTAYELEIMKIAEKDKKEMGGLETMAFQMGIFDSIPLKAQADMLVKSIKSVNKGDSEFKMMVELYKSQDIEAMAGSMKADSTGDASELSRYENILLTSRNKNWIPLIAKNSTDKSTFYAVGAGHLGGEMGVVNLLRKEGFTLKALK